MLLIACPHCLLLAATSLSCVRRSFIFELDDALFVALIPSRRRTRYLNAPSIPASTSEKGGFAEVADLYRWPRPSAMDSTGYPTAPADCCASLPIPTCADSAALPRTAMQSVYSTSPSSSLST